jgi:hypothetical protein
LKTSGGAAAGMMFAPQLPQKRASASEADPQAGQE